MTADAKQKHDPKGPPMKRNLEDGVNLVPSLKLKARKRKGSDVTEVGCPGCGSFRPPFCIAETKKGWRCDGCITDHRRHGRAGEIEEPAMQEPTS